MCSAARWWFACDFPGFQMGLICKKLPVRTLGPKTTQDLSPLFYRYLKKALYPSKQWNIYIYIYVCKYIYIYIAPFLLATISDSGALTKPCTPSGLTGKWMLHVQRHLASEVLRTCHLVYPDWKLSMALDWEHQLQMGVLARKWSMKRKCSIVYLQHFSDILGACLFLFISLPQ